MIQTDHIADPVIHLPSLRSLEIASPEYGHICLIERLALPNLVSLSVGAIHRPQDVYFPVCGLGDVGGTVLLKALARPSPVTGRSVFSKLREINLTRIGCDDEAAIAYMFTELTELLSLSLDDELAIMDWEDVLIKQWESIAHSNKEPLLPKLETFKTTRLSSESARELIQARKATGKPFKKASMGRTSVFTKEDEQWIRDHVDIFEHHDGLLGKVVLKTEI
ncbi:uncharacterized protein B0H18DRAFT_973210 [Fomitopsis serialis]|uniref:uncharacterized protein n=1 Tax=Fomitopsis serialis TaxID=139415 RepID=UPI00200721AF|nr:uncharacterized protein B0H18DRAFT_973210 [Neoantrodia serialis]KAH9936296.1 hypothetical protein B0H18DRAFT_973210 [Neoantrodia serialis]